MKRDTNEKGKEGKRERFFFRECPPASEIIMHYAEFPLLSGSARINKDNFSRCPFARRRSKKTFAIDRPNWPECPFVRELIFEDGHSERGRTVSHMFGVTAPRKMDSTNRTHVPGISRAPADGRSVVGNIATTATMMCLHVLMVAVTSCLYRLTHAIPVVDALPTISPCVDIYHVDPSHCRDSVERRVRRTCLVNRVDLVQLVGHATNPEDPYTVVGERGCKARHVQQDRLATVSDRAQWRAKLEESWRPTALALVMRTEKTRSLLCIADLARDQHRRGGRVVLTFPWTWNVLTPWPMQSALTEAPFLCAREGR